MYIREGYLEKIKKFKDTELVKVITGVRRSGKSTILKQYRDYLLSENIKEENIIYINFESSKWFEITDYKKLANYVKEHYENKKIYILLDEVQYVDKWEKAVNSFLVDYDCDVYITGSNAYLLSSELSTLISGRIINIHIFPFSFKEYNEIKKNNKIEENFKEYLTYGGMPLSLSFDDKDMISSYLMDIKDVVLKKDVIQRNRIKDVALLDNLLNYMASTIGNLTTSNAVAEYLSKNGGNTTNETIDNYLKYLENAYIIYRVPRFLLEGKELLKTQGKYYFVDSGLRNTINGYNSYDSGSAFENIIYTELLRRGFNVSVGKYKDLEIDFIAKKPEKIVYYQVARNISDEKVLDREKKSLLSIADNYEKVILTYDKIINSDLDGIKVINIIDWLLEI